MHRFETVVRMRHTDAAGVIYFARLFDMAHECYEAYFDSRIPLGAIVAGGDFLMPIVHAAANYRKPMRLGDRFDVEMSIGKVGNRSFEFRYVFLDQEGAVAAEVSTTHVVTDVSTGTARAIPDSIRDVLSELG